MQENKESTITIPIPNTNSCSQESFIRNISDHAEIVLIGIKGKQSPFLLHSKVLYLLFAP